ncbi:hypothetical protein [Marinobacter halophilus]|nr:hypothetical protein [Marinobacter halophilus]GGC77197.1 hypothetical protein GCM10011362_27220 [Marinobacter halophilus]
MKYTIAKAGLAAGLLMAAQVGWALPMLSFTSAQSDIEQTYQLGDTVSMDVWISGLDPASGGGLGGFNLSVGYDGAVTDYKSTVFGDTLAEYSFFPPSASETGSNGVDLDGVALAGDLSDQPEAFELFTLEFLAASVGTSSLTFGSVLLSDASGDPLVSGTNSATLNVVAPPVKVSEPGSLALLMIGLAAGVIGRYRSRSSAASA